MYLCMADVDSIRKVQMKFTEDKDLLYRHFKKDPVLFGYHIGDLEGFYFDYCRWAIETDDSGEIDKAILIYDGLSVPTVLAFGLNVNFNPFLKEVMPYFPDRFYCHFQKECREILKAHFIEESLGIHQKMKLTNFRLFNAAISKGRIMRLNSSNGSELWELYERSYPGSYFDDRMLKTGKYFGYVENGDILSVSGIHVYSGKYDIAVLGNIVTHPEHRGRGLATAVTAHLVNELAGEGKLVILNVKSDNEPAIRCYSRLGFEKVCEYEESIFARMLE